MIDNPYLPLTAGHAVGLRGRGATASQSDIEVEVLDETREIEGITAIVVRDTVYVDGELAEDTYDWFAQDEDGNVWYLGEDTNEYEDGEVVNAEGSWEYGLDGALPGIVMPADPAVGRRLPPGVLRGRGRGHGRGPAQVGATRTIGLGTYEDVLVTEDWTPLEPEVIEEKWYAPGVGLIYERQEAGSEGEIELVEFTPAG